MPAPESVIALIQRFEEQYDSYRQPGYNETQVRREFVDPLFIALGWDVLNTQGHAEAYKEVIHEDAVRVGGATKAPDYSFRVGPVRKFFVETKKPSVNIQADPSSAFQLRRYGWSAKLALCVLTDFEEFAVYDTRMRPSKDDDASTARVMYLRYDEYVDRWDEIVGVFSRDAILSGAFDRYADSRTRKRGTAEVDDAFLKEIEGWRMLLAKEIAQRNEALSQRKVNTAVQNTIDRIVFLRICEDRGIETYGRLQALLNGTAVYKRLGQLFEEADDRYNSGLFHFHKEKSRSDPPDEWTLGLTISDKPLKQILRHLYYPDSPYEFSVLGADILGQVYEQFLGKVIVLTKSHRAKIEEKPEVRKAGGVYYTPTYIVDYIVRQTVGELVKDRKPHEVAGRTQATFKPATGKQPITVLDPACGSGSFLIGAYQFLLDWYLQQYVAGDPARFKDRVYQTRHDEWRLTTAERKRILLDHIYGVDIDSQAVEVTKLSLLLKVLEGESSESLERQMTMFRERALPDLTNNIKCGNSLIGPDFYDTHQLEMFDEEEVYRINAFDWHEEFKRILTTGGFDAIIGNPPYLSHSGRQAVSLEPAVRAYFEERLPLSGWLTLHGLFIVKVLRLSKHFIGFIVPDQVGHLDGYKAVRDDVACRSRLTDVRYWGERVFRGIVTPALTMIANNRHSGPTRIQLAGGEPALRTMGSGDPWLPRSPHAELIQRLHELSQPLDNSFADPGVHSGNCAKELIFSGDKPYDDCVPVLEGKLVGRYSCRRPAKYLRLGYLPRESEYFTVRPLEKYRRAPFVIRQTAAYPIVGPRFHADYFRNSLLALYPPSDGRDVRFVVAVLNSRLMRYVYEVTVKEAGQKAFPQVKVRSLRSLPIRGIDFNNNRERLAHDAIVAMVDEMIDLQRRLEEMNSTQVRSVVARRIAGIDNQIERMVTDLYGLTPQQIDSIETCLNQEIQ